MEQLKIEYELLIRQLNPDLKTAERLFQIFSILENEIIQRENEINKKTNGQ